MSNYERMKTGNCRPILGLFGCRYTGLQAILSLSLLLLLLSPALPPVGAQPSSNGNGNPNDPYQYARFSPSIAILIAVLITVLFLMAFFSIYIRHCSGTSGSSIRNLAGLGASIRSRRNAARGLDAAVIETFPTLDYSAVKDLHIGKGALECAICLTEFEDDETLRLIPKCDHVFHPDCIDAWLASHVTCPVCRTNLVPQPGETFQVPDLNAGSNPAPEIDNPQNGDVSIPVSDDAQPTQQPPQVVDRNRSLNRNRPPRSKSVRLVGSRLLGNFSRSHSTGHSLVQPGENVDRFTLKLPEDVRKQVMNRTSSCLVTLPRDASSRRGNRTGGGGEGSSRGRNSRRLDRSLKSDRWLFSVAPPFISRASSVRNSKAVVPDGEGTSSTTSKSLATAADAV